VGIALLATACATVDPEPFEKFHVTTDRVRSSTDALLLLDYEWSRRGFVDQLTRQSPEDLRALFLRFDEADPFTAELPDPPLFLAVNRARDHLAELSSAFSEYGQLLAGLAGSDLTDPESFDDLARKLNARLRDIARGLGKSRSGNAAEFTLFSGAASEAFRTYIQRRRLGDLRAAIESTQPLLEGWARIGAEALDSVRDDIRTEYESRKVDLSRRYAEARRKKPKDQRRLIEEVIDLDATVVDAFSSLRALRAAFASMPAAHRQLGESIGNPGSDLPQMQVFYDHGLHVRALRQRLTGKKDP
jgi:hypothetical protein